MKEWIMELCPEIAEWKVDLIVEHAEKVTCPSCGSNKVECSVCADEFTVAQPRQEPVAWLLRWNDDGAARTTVRLTKPDGGWTPDCLFPLYTAPQPQQWVGLTSDERYGLALQFFKDTWFLRVAEGLSEAIEAKLREKNGGGV